MCVVGLGLPQPILLGVLNDLSKSNVNETSEKMIDYLEKINSSLDSYKKIKKVRIICLCKLYEILFNETKRLKILDKMLIIGPLLLYLLNVKVLSLANNIEQWSYLFQ